MLLHAMTTRTHRATRCGRSTRVFDLMFGLL